MNEKRARFYNVQDGKELPKTMGFEVDDDEQLSLPPSKSSLFLCSEEEKSTVLSFLELYYKVRNSIWKIFVCMRLDKNSF